MEAVKIALLADSYAYARANRLVKQAEVTILEEQEKELKAALDEAMRNAGMSTVGGLKYIIKRTESLEPTLENDALFYQHVRATGEFDLLYRRINAKAIKERRDVGVNIPGVNWFPVSKLTVSKKPT